MIQLFMVEYVVDKAVLPLAGHSLRFSPYNEILPKSLFPLGKRPIIDYAIEELLANKISKLLCIISEESSIIEKYLGDGKKYGLKIEYKYCNNYTGPADAVLQSRDWVKDSSFIILFPNRLIQETNNENIIISSRPLSRLIEVFNRNNCDIVFLSRKLDETNNFFSNETIFTDSSNCNINKKCNHSPQRIIEPFLDILVSGKWICKPVIFDYLSSNSKSQDGEFRLPQIIPKIIETKNIWHVPLIKKEKLILLQDWDLYNNFLGILNKYNWNIKIM